MYTKTRNCQKVAFMPVFDLLCIHAFIRKIENEFHVDIHVSGPRPPERPAGLELYGGFG